MDLAIAEAMISYNGHDAECLCTKCMMADMDNHILMTRGQEALDRINLKTNNDRKAIDTPKKFGKAPGSRSGRGIVRGMSEAQKKYAAFLINTRDTSNMKMLTGWTLDIAKLDSISLRHAVPFIDALKACPEKPRPIASNDSVRNTIQGSDKQIAWITKTLIPERNLTESDITNMFVRTQYKASAIISELLAMPKATKTTNTTKEPLTEGMYVTPDNRIFKVYENQEHTRILCKELIDGSFEYLGMAQYKLPKDARKMTIEEAKEYGKVTGTCCVCSRRLTDEGSIEAGIGPVCASKF